MIAGLYAALSLRNIPQFVRQASVSSDTSGNGN